MVKYLIQHWALDSEDFTVEQLNFHWKQLYTPMSIGLDFGLFIARKPTLYLHIKVTA